MTNRQLINQVCFAVLALALSLEGTNAATTDLSSVPLYTYNPPSSLPKPNIMFILDNSGSMAWTHMPDQSADPGSTVPFTYGFYGLRSNQCNGVYYNPAITYRAPVNADGTQKSNASFSAAWGDGFNPGSTINLNSAFRAEGDGSDQVAYFYNYTGTQTTPVQKNYYDSTTTFALECSSANNSSPGKYMFGKVILTTSTPPTNISTTIDVSGSSSASVSQISVNGVNLMSGVSTASSTSSTVATNVAAKITLNGFSASSGGTSTITITGPTATAGGFKPVVTLASGSATLSAVPFPQYDTDAAHHTNFANWYSYYRTRMNMMKSASGWAFKDIDDTYRVGFMTINSGGTDFLNINDFTSTNKSDWYAALYGASPSGSTPLRTALSNAGRMYAGKISTINGVSVVDPLQCYNQQNYSILSTDGFWNTGIGYKLDGTTEIGNEDAALPVPYNDGGTSTVQKSTSQLQQRSGTLQWTKETSTLQSRTVTPRWTKITSQLQSQTITPQWTNQTSQLQTRTSTTLPSRQTRTSTDSGVTWTAWTDVGSCTRDTSGSFRRDCRAPKSTSSDSGVTWTPWDWVYSDQFVNNTCTSDNSGTNQTRCSGASITTPWTDTSSCTAGGVTQCQYTAWVNNTATGSCTNLPQSASPNYTVGTAVRNCASTTPLLGTWTSVANCTPSSALNCRYLAGTPSTVTSCTVVDPSPASPYTVQNPVSCTPTTPTYGSWTPAATCTTSSTLECGYTSWSGATTVTSCTPLDPSSASPYMVATATRCTPATTLWGSWIDASSCTTSSTSQCQYTSWTGYTTASSCTPLDQSAASPYTVGLAVRCQTLSSGGSSDTLSDVAAYYYNTDLRTNSLTNCSGASALGDLCASFVPSADLGRDVASWQHMTTFTIGLGVRGRMVYNPDGISPNAIPPYDYWGELPTQDFGAIRDGTLANGSNICSWQSSGNCTWPLAGMSGSDGKIENVDDLWHAAINGHGTFYNTTDAESLSSAIAGVINNISVSGAGTAAAAATSNPNISSSDNYLFSSSYAVDKWYGELIRQQIFGLSNISAQEWSAMGALDCAMGSPAWVAGKSYVWKDTFIAGGNCYLVVSPAGYQSGTAFANDPALALVTASPGAGRNIYTNITGRGALAGQPFNFSTLTTAQKAYFTAPYLTYNVSAQSGLSQFCTTGSSCLSSTLQTDITSTGAAGENLVKFLSGDRTYELTRYRQRNHVLGDIVSSEARYVKTPLFNYTDAGYSSYKTAQASRAGIIYVGANDGMLHAFRAETGEEAWAYIPSYVLPSLYKLADMNYQDHHQFYVDGSPEVGDIYVSGAWKTILVGSLNLGGKGYYALDITDPAAPKLLWEFTDANMGYSYGNPRITKLSDGTWVVILTSGYNNADGHGHVYVLNADTGVKISGSGGDIANTVGSSTNPSGLARISAHVLAPDTNNTVIAVYGGDLLGNLWRFDVNGNIGAAGYDAQLLVSLKDAGGNPQPITAKPTLSSVEGHTVVYVGTGKFLGLSDIGTSTYQSYYAVKDKLTATTLGNPRTTGNGFVEQTMTETTCPADAPLSVCTPGSSVRTVVGSGCQPINWSDDNGWFVDLVTAGERASTDTSLIFGTLYFTTNVPNLSVPSTCDPATDSNASSYLYELNYKNGCSVEGTSSVAGISLGRGLVTRPVIARLPDGRIVGFIRGTGGSGTQTSGTDSGTTRMFEGHGLPTTPFPRRISWRELITE